MSETDTALTKDMICKCADMRVQRVDVPALGGHVYVRVVPYSDYERIAEKAKGADLNRRIVALYMCDEHAEPLLAPGELGIVGRMPSDVVLDIVKAAMRFNNLDVDDDGAAAVENSDGTT